MLATFRIGATKTKGYKMGPRITAVPALENSFWATGLELKLLGGIPTPLKNVSSSVGMIKFPIYGKIVKNQIHVPNHQPVTCVIM